MTAVARARAIGLAVAALVFAADRGLKLLVTDGLGLHTRGDHYDLLPFFDFTRENNYGVSLGLFTAQSLEMRWGLVAMTSVIAVVVLVWLLRERKVAETAALGAILGGAIGNIRDRIAHGYVIDYADLHFGDFRPFLIFNLADAAISIGVVIILARSLLLRDKDDGAEPAHDLPSPEPLETR